MLAVEVVSPAAGSVDRVVKPNQYARAEIPHYWRIETEPDVVVYTYQLGKGPKHAPARSPSVRRSQRRDSSGPVFTVAKLSEED